MKERYFSTFQLILLALFAALIVVAKIALRLPLQLSGHSGIFWMAIVIVAAGVVPKVGAASLVGLTSGIIAAFLGMGDFGALNTFLSYTMVGVGTDLALLFLGRKPENLVVAAIWRHLWPLLQIPGQVGHGRADRRAGGICRPGPGAGHGRLRHLWRAGWAAGRLDAGRAAAGWLFCLPGRETLNRRRTR